ncbi:cutinase family protein [Microbacterium sp. 2FI]|uniref:cutinase family protein n=1 Tax=Microbacterium sp. 2FI TaxID=2502193 RepID=UPI0010F90556|nr:cutinase family protein [Microbacterium sp. 2FI]
MHARNVIRSAIAGAAAIVVLASSLVVAGPALAAAVDNACTDVEAVFARGSGQGLGAGEATRFSEQLVSRIAAPVTLNYYELGTASVEGHQYPAVPVGTGSWDSATNSSGAFFSGGGAFEYGGSVDKGVDELDDYIAARLAKCPSALFILGGYSQGAQVVGETYVERLTASEREHVVFAMHFGDPKLYLPEGESFLWNAAPACEGKEFSAWRRVVPNCDTDDGSLGARKPYLPSSWQNDTGLWCADHDFVCGSSKAVWDADGHGTYGLAGGDIDKGVQEAVERLRERMPASEDDLDASPSYLQSGTTGLDVVFLIDSTGSMSWMINQAKAVATTLSSFVAANRGRVALVEYRDAGDEFTARILTPFSEDIGPFATALDAISVDGGGDTPEALLHALMTGFNGLDWRPGATKAAVVLTDAEYHDPDQVDGSTLPMVAARSLEIDPVNVYPVVPSYLAEYYEPMAEATTGEVVVNEGDAAQALSDALTKIESRPVPMLVLNRYAGDVGSTIHFDAGPSYSTTSTIEQWDWDFDGDGVYEIIDGESTADHTYDAEFDGFVQLRVTDADGLIANFSAPVRIGPPPPPVAIPADSVGVTGEGAVATVSWVAPVDPPKGWSLTVDGVHVGLIAPDARTARIGDIARDETVEFGVTPVTEDDVLGQTRLAYLDPDDGTTATPSPSPSPDPSPTPDPTDTGAPVDPDPGAGPSLQLSATSVTRGGSLTITGSGFDAGDVLEIWIRSTPVLLGSSTADADGSFTATVTIPLAIEAGSHTIAVVYGDAESTTPVTVIDPSASAAGGEELSGTGGEVPMGVVIGGLALLAGGILLLVVRGTRRARSSRV